VPNQISKREIWKNQILNDDGCLMLLVLKLGLFLQSRS